MSLANFRSKGRVVRSVYVVEDTTIARELYLSLLVDRSTGRVAFVASTEGGVNIEEVAAKTPELITTIDVDPASGLSGFHGRVIYTRNSEKLVVPASNMKLLTMSAAAERLGRSAGRAHPAGANW